MLNRDLATHKNRPMLEVQACCKICKVYEKETKVISTVIYLYTMYLINKLASASDKKQNKTKQKYALQLIASA